MNETNGTSAKRAFPLNDRKNLRVLREGIEENLAEFAKEHGLKITAGHISYERDGTKASVKLEVVAPNEAGVFVPQHEKDFVAYAHWFGFKPEQLHSIVTVGGTKYEVVGLRPKAKKNPLVVERIGDRKQFVVAERYLETARKPELVVIDPPSRTGGAE